MAIQIKALEETLLARLADYVSTCGFDRLRGQSFQKSFPWGKNSLHLSFIRHAVDFDVTADVAVRFDDLEDLIQQNNTELSRTEKRNTFSLGADLGNIAHGKQMRWSVASEIDAQRRAKEIFDFFLAIGIPYLDRFSDMKNALDVFASDEPSAWRDSPFHGERAKRAVGLAWLMKDEQRVRQLIKTKDEFLEQRRDVGLASFRAFVMSLRN